MNEDKKTSYEYGLYKLNEMDLIDTVEDFAKQEHDGHYTILSFTTGYKVVFGTPDLSYQSMAYEKLFNLPDHVTLKDALIYAILYQSVI